MESPARTGLASLLSTIVRLLLSFHLSTRNCSDAAYGGPRSFLSSVVRGRSIWYAGDWLLLSVHIAILTVLNRYQPCSLPWLLLASVYQGRQWPQTSLSSGCFIRSDCARHHTYCELVTVLAVRIALTLNVCHQIGTLEAADKAFFGQESIIGAAASYDDLAQPLDLFGQSIRGVVIVIGDGLLVRRLVP